MKPPPIPTKVPDAQPDPKIIPIPKRKDPKTSEIPTDEAES